MRKSKDTEKKVCLTTIQMENIIDAARDEPNVCPKAKAWVNNFRPKKEENPIFRIIDKKIDQKAKAMLRKFQRWF